MLALFSEPLHINYSDAMASFSIYEEGDTGVGDVADDCNKPHEENPFRCKK